MHSTDRLTPQKREELGSLANTGISIAALARRFNVTRSTARRWAAEARKPTPNWSDAPGRGRPALLNSSERRKAKRSARSGHTVTQVAASLNNNRHQPVSSSTVRRALITGRHPMQWAVKKRGRVLSDKNKKARLLFALANSRAHSGCWLFADSKHFYCYKDGTGSMHYEWQDIGEEVTVLRSSNPIHFHVYAIVGKGLKSQLFFTAPSPPRGSKDKHGNETFASKHFHKVAHQIKQVVHGWGKDDARHPLILDHASQHTSKTSKEAISSIGLNLKQGFPAQCWDINVIENVWGVFDTKLNALAGRLPTTGDGWRRRLNRAWAQVDQTTIDKLVGQVKGRLASIVEKKGAWLHSYGQ